jgi:hypothetical protein
MSRFDEMVRRARLRSGEEPPVPLIDPQTAGQFAADLHASEFALANGGIIYREPPPRPTTGEPLQDEINALEVRLNRVKSETFQLEEAGGIRDLKFARQNAKKAAERARIDLALADVLPAYDAKLAELAELASRHRDLLSRRATQSAHAA